MADQRETIYRSLHKGHIADEDMRISSAHTVLSLTRERETWNSVLDVGCGRGIWLAVAAELGAQRLVGIEGPWIQDESLYCDREWIRVKDLEGGFDLGEKFDLVISLEVAEHLQSRSANRFVEALVRHGEFILFSAAIPYQGGIGHVNEQFAEYWQRIFKTHNYLPLDFIRRKIWKDASVMSWFRQNVIVYAHSDYVARNRWAADAYAANGPISIVHPEIYAYIVGRMTQQLTDTASRQSGSKTQ